MTLERLMKPRPLRDLSRHFFRGVTIRKCLSQTRTWPTGPSQGSHGSSSAALWVGVGGHRRVTGMTSRPEAADGGRHCPTLLQPRLGVTRSLALGLVCPVGRCGCEVLGEDQTK